MASNDNSTPDATVTELRNRRFDARDFDTIAQFIVDEKDKRKKARKDMEKQWDEIDRQLRMEPKTAYKYSPVTGNYKPGMSWLPEKELPLQAQTLEILCADARRMIFPDNGPWFRAHALMTDEYLSKVDFQALISGDENDVPSKINQDNADKIVEGVMADIHEQSGLFQQIDRFNAEAFKYGTAVGRVRKAKKPTYIETARGVTKDTLMIPVFFASSIKDVYLDTTQQLVMNEGHVLGPSTIFYKRQKLTDLVLAAKNGSSDPKNEDGGWMPGRLKDLQSDKDGLVEVIRFEGDLIVERKSVDNLFIPGAIVTVVVAGSESRVVRMAFREKPFCSYITQAYHLEHVNSPYGVGPLMKGEPLQAACTEMLCRLLQSAILNTEPPIKYDPDDPSFASTGGPLIEPRALWGSSGDVVPVEIGNPTMLLQSYTALLQHYSDVTGINAPRLGQQTLSHTTAYAKGVELTQGQVRTVDYANSMLDNAMGKILDMQFSYLADVWGQERDIWIPEYGGFVRVWKDVIPPSCVFEIFGSQGPAEDRARAQDQMAAIQTVIQIDQLKVQSGLGAPLDYDALQKMILKRVGFSDVDVLFTSPSSGSAGPAPGGPGVPGAAPGSPGTTSTALQALAFGAPPGAGLG